MAETVPENVVNGNQSMGGDPAPIDAPEETQSSNYAVVEGASGDVETQKNTTSLSDQYAQVPQHTFAALQSEDRRALPEQDGTWVQTADTLQNNDQASGYLALHPDSGLPNGGDVSSAFPDASPLDADAAELEWRRPSLDRNERSNSYKKPTSFKSVSVTKNFLAKSSPGLASPNKTGVDKLASPSSIQPPSASAAKPRLIAKSMRDARSPALAGPGTAAAPDASKVWNRNKPTPTAPQRQFTDEELKQQYGIHLATRLQADEPGKGSKWADMEDDEDDWAPETVEWMDGTKTTLQPENQPPPPSTSKLQSRRLDVEDAQQDPDMYKSPSSLGPGKTVLRPGAVRNQTTLKPGLVLKSVPESQESPSKPTSNGSSKSPWAQLPPIDKVSPVTFYPPVPASQHTPSSLGPDSAVTASMSGSAADSNLPILSPAREIAADTFDRSWRNSERGSRELFEPKSGRYEPARGARRTSFRQEGNFRPPSLLQRPSQFEQDKDYGSQDVRSIDRRPSPLSADKRSVVEEAQENVTSPSVARSDTSLNQKPASDTSHPNNIGNQRLYAAHSAEGSATSPHVDGASSDVQVQQQLMRQRIEANRRRKQEEQAREEAEKQERIRQRLQALDVTSPVSVESQQIEVAGRTLPSVPPQADGTSNATLNAPATREKSPQSSAIDKEVTIHEVESQGAVVPSTSLPQQLDEPPQHLDGLGALPLTSSLGPPHQTIRSNQSANALTTSSGSPSNQPSQFAAQPTKSPQLPSVNFPHTSSTQISNQSSNSHSHSHPHSHFFKPHSDPNQLSSSDTRTFSNTHTPSPASFEQSRHHWASAQTPLSQAGWSSNTGQPSSISHSNVWGPPPTNDKALGNGSFQPDLHRPSSHNYPPSHFRHSPQPPPGPIAPPSVSPRPQSSSRHDLQSQPHINTAMAPVEVLPSPTTGSFAANPTTTTDANGRITRTYQPAQAPAPRPKQSAGFPAHINFDVNAYGKGAKKTSNNVRGGLSRPAITGNLGDRWHTENTIQRDFEARAAVVAAERYSKINETTKATGRTNQASFRENETFARPAASAATPQVEPVSSAMVQPESSQSVSSQLSSTQPEAIQSASASTEVDPITTEKKEIEHIIPEMPAEATSELFGPSKSKVVVKLTPTSEEKIFMVLPDNKLAGIKMPPASGMNPPRHSAPPQQGQFNAPIGMQPIVKNITWQHKFNDLLKVVAQEPTSNNVAAVTSATKPTFGPTDIAPVTVQPAISLPFDSPIGGIKTGNVADTKDTEKAVFQEPENGSRPGIAVPAKVPIINKSFADSAFYQKRAESPSTKTVSSMSDEEMEERIRITIALANSGKYGTPPKGKRPYANATGATGPIRKTSNAQSNNTPRLTANFGVDVDRRAKPSGAVANAQNNASKSSSTVSHARPNATKPSGASSSNQASTGKPTGALSNGNQNNTGAPTSNTHNNAGKPSGAFSNAAKPNNGFYNGNGNGNVNNGGRPSSTPSNNNFNNTSAASANNTIKRSSGWAKPPKGRHPPARKNW